MNKIADLRRGWMKEGPLSRKFLHPYTHWARYKTEYPGVYMKKSGMRNIIIYFLTVFVYMHKHGFILYKQNKSQILSSSSPQNTLLMLSTLYLHSSVCILYNSRDQTDSVQRVVWRKL